MGRIIAGLNIWPVTSFLEPGLGNFKRSLFRALCCAQLLYHAVHLHNLFVYEVEVGGELAVRVLRLADPLLEL